MDPNPSDLEDETMAIPVMNPFSRFAFNPSLSRTKSSNGEKLQGNDTAPVVRTSPRKRKGNKLEGDREDTTKPKKISKVSPASKSKNTELPSASKVKLYDHLDTIPDHLTVGLDIMFCGINPGQQSAEIGHHYGNPNNHFWSCLHESGLTSRRLDPREDHLLPEQFSIGLTNLVDRPTVQQNELSKQEQIAAVPSLLDKVSRFRPRVVCFVGLGIAEIVSSSISAGADLARGKKRSSQRLEKAVVGLQTYKVVHSESTSIACDHAETVFFAVSSTSGRVVRYQKKDKVQQFKDLHDLSVQLKEGRIDTSSMTPMTPPS